MRRNFECLNTAVYVIVFAILFTALTTTTAQSREVPRGYLILSFCSDDGSESGEIEWCLRDWSNTTITSGTTVEKAGEGTSIMTLNTTTLQEGVYTLMCFLGSIENKDTSSIKFFITVLRKYM